MKNLAVILMCVFSINAFAKEEKFNFSAAYNWADTFDIAEAGNFAKSGRLVGSWSWKFDNSKSGNTHFASTSLTAGGGSQKINGKGLFIEPTIFANATNDIRISKEEIFGPVLPIIRFSGEEEAIRMANDTPYGLASGIQTGSMSRGLRLADKIKAGTVWLNTWHKYHPSAPFGGYKMSGYGREQGSEALESYSQYKTIWANLEH
jgi:hypothetical protein